MDPHSTRVPRGKGSLGAHQSKLRLSTGINPNSTQEDRRDGFWGWCSISARRAQNASKLSLQTCLSWVYGSDANEENTSNNELLFYIYWVAIISLPFNQVGISVCLIHEETWDRNPDGLHGKLVTSTFHCSSCTEFPKVSRLWVSTRDPGITSSFSHKPQSSLFFWNLRSAQGWPTTSDNETTAPWGVETRITCLVNKRRVRLGKKCNGLWKVE